MNQNQVAATLDTHYGDKRGLEDQHVNAGCPNFIIEKHDQQVVLCLNDQGGSVMQVEQDGIAGTLRANTHGNEQIVCAHGAETPISNTEGFANPVTANHNGLENVVLYSIDQGGGKSSCSITQELPPTLATTHGGEPAVCEVVDRRNTSGVRGVCHRGVDVYNCIDTGDITATLTANSGEPNTAGPKVMTRAIVRRLLPIECERLMGFPDNWTRIPWKGKPEEECPDSPRYKACGNSMCVNVMRWIGMRIEIAERRMRDEN